MAETSVVAPVSRMGEQTLDGPLVGAARTAESAVRRVREKAVEVRDRLAEKPIGELVEDGREIVRANPLRTVLIAAGIGALIGYAIGRRRA